MELRLFVLKKVFIKQSTKVNSGYSLFTTSDNNNRRLVKTLLDQASISQEQLTHKNAIFQTKRWGEFQN